MQTLKKRLVTIKPSNFIRCVSAHASLIAKKVDNLKSFKEIPGPSSLPIIGPLLNYLPGGTLACKGNELSDRLYKLYGPIIRLNGSFGEYDKLILYDPEAAEHVFRSEEPMPVRPIMETMAYYRKRYNKTYDPKRNVGLNDQGENWRYMRTKLNPILMHPKTIKPYTDVLRVISNDMVARLRSIRDENNQVKKTFNSEMNLWALESIGVVALGTRLNCFNPNLPADSPVKKLIQNAHDIFKLLDTLEFGPSLWRKFSTPEFKKAMKIYEEHERLTKYFIDQAKENLKSRKNMLETSHSEKPILEKLLEIDDETANVTASDFLMAGIDTVANTVLLTLYLLAVNPEKQHLLRQEVLAKQSRNPFLKACIKESMRMMPVAAFSNMRLTTKEYDLLGYKIPKDVLVIVGNQFMSNIEEHYPKPDQYLPERWLAEKDDPLYYRNTHRFVVVPWGYGVRMCAGRRIAELEMETIISTLIANFQIDWPSNEPLHVTPTFLNYVTEPFHFVFKDI